MTSMTSSSRSVLDSPEMGLEPKTTRNMSVLDHTTTITTITSIEDEVHGDHDHNDDHDVHDVHDLHDLHDAHDAHDGNPTRLRVCSGGGLA